MLDSLKVSLTQKLHPVHKAESEKEYEAIWAFRYKACISELNRHDIPELNHDNCWLRYESDELESTSLFYTGSMEDIKATIAVRVFNPGEVPKVLKTEYSLGAFKDLDKQKVVEMSSHSFDTSMSGHAATTALVYQTYELALEEEADLLFISCIPEHLKIYEDLGLRPYGARALNKDCAGLLVPLIGLLDIDYYKEIHSLLYHIFKKAEGAGKKVNSDVSPLMELIYEACGSAESNQDVIKNEILASFRESIVSDASTFNFLTFLPEHIITQISESSQIINVKPGEQVIQQDVRDQELYYILSGLLEVRQESKVLAKIKHGETLGEVGFFRESGKRSASVFAGEQTRVLIIRKSFLNAMVKKHPADACLFYEALSRIMAEQIANS